MQDQTAAVKIAKQFSQIRYGTRRNCVRFFSLKTTFYVRSCVLKSYRDAKEIHLANVFKGF